jgi:glycerol-3-phosphate dehydrogenase
MESYDLAVIGGGLTGTAVARDAAGRGLSALLVEALDFGEGASSATGGVVLRPLEQLDPFGLQVLRTNAAERELLMEAAPHLVQPTHFLMPEQAARWPRWRTRLQLAVAGRFAARLKSTRRLRFGSEVSHGLLRRDLSAGHAFTDCVADDSRLTVLNAVDARIRGATVRPRVRCTVAERQAGHWRLSLEATSTREAVAVEARVLINAAGAAVADVNDHVIHTDRRLAVRLMKRAYVVARRRVPEGEAYALPTPTGAPIYVVPFAADLALVGPHAVPLRGEPDDLAAAAADVSAILDVANGYLHAPIGEDDVISGVAAACAEPVHGRGRGWTIEIDAPPRQAQLVTIIGASLNSHRLAAEAAISAVVSSTYRPWTSGAALPGGGFPPGGAAEIGRALAAAYPFLDGDQAMRLARAYGTRAQEILIGCRAAADLGCQFGAGLTEVEVNYLRREEWAESAADILWRRTKLGFHMTAAEAAYLESWLRRHPRASWGPVML